MRAIRTVGYEGASLEQFLSRMRAASVDLVIDVRELPLSRKKGFSKTAFKTALEEHGIRYVHLKSLGDPKPGRDAARAGRIPEFRKIFRAHMKTPRAKAELSLAADLASRHDAVLLCYERQPSLCHRAIVAEALRLTYGFSIEHLDILDRSVIRDDTNNQRASRCACEGRSASRL